MMVNLIGASSFRDVFRRLSLNRSYVLNVTARLVLVIVLVQICFMLIDIQSKVSFSSQWQQQSKNEVRQKSQTPSLVHQALEEVIQKSKKLDEPQLHTEVGNKDLNILQDSDVGDASGSHCAEVDFAKICDNGEVFVSSVQYYKAANSRLPIQNSILPGFQYVIMADVCKKSHRTVKYLFIVHSKANHFRHRNLIRATWGQNLSTHNASLVFNVASVDDPSLLHDLAVEAKRYHDIIQSSHLEHYRNMTYKNMMGLQYAGIFCPSLDYVFKIDDDWSVDVSDLLEDFKMMEKIPEYQHGEIYCKVIGGQPNRNPRSKWYAKRQTYPAKAYPYYCFGAFIIYKMDAVRKILKVAPQMPYYHVDDLHVTGHVAQAAGIYPPIRIALDFLKNEHQLHSYKGDNRFIGNE